MAPRLREKYINEVAPSLQKELGLENVMQIPKLEKIVVNDGPRRRQPGPEGDRGGDRRAGIDHRSEAAYQPRPQVDRRVQAPCRHPDRCLGDPAGDRMWEFFDRLLSVAIPRVRDFRGLNPRSFDAGATTPSVSTSSSSSPSSTSTM